MLRSAGTYYWSKTKKQIIPNKIASFVIVGAMLPITVAPFAAPNSQPEVNDFQSNLVLDSTSPYLLENGRELPKVIPGESQIQKEAREKAEAEARAKAQADAAARQRETISREYRVYNDPSNFDNIYAGAQNAFGVDARLLKAIHHIETGGSGSTSRKSYAGAQGPMQFLPSTWRRHAVDANGDGVADINNVEDAIYTAAAYLRACGYPDVQKALWGYNPSTSYYNKVMNLARSYGM